MTTDLLMQILQWLIPIGSVGTVVTWFAHRDTRKDRAVKEKNDIYKEMYDNISGTLIELQNENKKLYRAISRLERAVTKATTCKHYADCPMRGELQEQARDDEPIRPKHRQPATSKTHRHMVRDGPGFEGEVEPSDGQRG